MLGSQYRQRLIADSRDDPPILLCELENRDTASMESGTVRHLL
jgi:hypothetical protein